MNIFKRLDFKFHLMTLLPLSTLLLTVPAMKFLPVEYTYENHLIENFQLLVLLAAFILCIKSKTDKNFFNTLALVCVILFLREINCGRTIFFPVEGLENTFYGWKDIPYGWLANPIYGIFMAFSFLYFLYSKSYLVLFRYIARAKISVFNWLFLFLGIIFGTLGEKTGNFALEEMTELLFYFSFLVLIYLQGFNKHYIDVSK